MAKENYPEGSEGRDKYVRQEAVDLAGKKASDRVREPGITKDQPNTYQEPVSFDSSQTEEEDR